MIDPEMLKILACPACKSKPPVREDAQNSRLVCTVCGKTYPVQDGIPVMFAEKNG